MEKPGGVAGTNGREYLVKIGCYCKSAICNRVWIPVKMKMGYKGEEADTMSGGPRGEAGANGRKRLVKIGSDCKSGSCEKEGHLVKMERGRLVALFVSLFSLFLY